MLSFCFLAGPSAEEFRVHLSLNVLSLRAVLLQRLAAKYFHLSVKLKRYSFSTLIGDDTLFGINQLYSDSESNYNSSVKI